MTNSGTSGRAPATADEPAGDGAGSTVWYTDGTVAEFDLNGHLFRRTLPDGTVLSASDASQPADTSSEPANADPPTDPRGDAEPVPDTRILRQQTADGTVLESFDSLDRPHAGIANGNHFTITYRPDGGNLTCYEDGSSAEYDAGGGLVRQTTVDGTVYSSSDGQGRPHAGVAEGSSFTIDYRAADDSSIVRYADGSAARFDAEGSVVWQDTGDGTVYSEFDAQHRPLAGSVDGEPFRVNYRPDGHSVTRYADGSVVEFGADGVVLSQSSPDGTVFSGFDGSGRPTEGFAGGQDFSISYGPDGHSVTRYADGSVVEFGADGVVLRQVSPDGTVFSGFDGSGRPTEGFAGGQDFSISYGPDGHSVTRYADGSVVEFGADGVVLRQVSPDGTVFSGFDGSGRPTEGFAGGQDFSISYRPDGHSVTRYADGSVVEFGADGVVLRQVSPDGTVYSGFDGSGRPTEGSAADGQDFTLEYPGNGNTITRYADGSVVEFGADGVVLRQVSPDGTVYSGFDGSGRPTEGSAADGQDFTLEYPSNGNTITRYADGATAEFNPDGIIIRQVTPDGTVYISFDAENRPDKGYSPDSGAFTVEYPSEGHTVYRYDSGLVVEYGPNSLPIRQVLPDTTTFTSFDEDGRPTQGTAPDGVSISITYQDNGGSEITYGSGVLVRYNAQGDPYFMRTADGSVFTEFYESGDPKSGETAEGVSVGIVYNSDGGSEITYGSGVVVRVNENGDPVWMKTSDGSVFTEFYESGDPKSGKTAEGVSVGIVYNSDGGSEITYGSGVVVRVNENGDPVWMKTSDGSVFTEFYESGDPKSGKTAEGVSVGIVYNSDGGSEITYGSGVVVRVNENGDPYWMKTSDGSIFTEFDEKGRPEKGKTSTGEDIDITYNTGDDGYKVVVGDKVTVYGPDGAPIKMTVGDDLIFDTFEAGFFRRGYDVKTNRFFGIEYLPNGDVRWVFGKDDWIEFDPNGTPTEGFRPGPDGGHFSFAVEIDKLASAADFTGLRRRDIATELGDLQSALKSVEAHWRSPAGGSFQAYAAVLKTAGDNLLAMLDESERRLRATYHNYLNAESQNAGNFTPK